jgi:UDP-glucose 4-epimerase
MAKYLVTGGAGFIGSNIVTHLIKMGEWVRVLDNFSTGKRENLAHMDGNERLQVIEGDIRDIDIVKEAVSGCDFVLHQAAIPSVQRSIDDPITSNEVNVSGIINILIACRDEGVKRLVFASSSSVYGDQNGNSPIRSMEAGIDTGLLPKKEDLLPNPLSPYGITKLAGEYYCKVFYAIYGLETVILRYFNVFGPRQDPYSEYSAVIPRFILAMLEGRPPVIYGDGEQSRDFTYVDNVIQANIKACHARGVAGRVINIGCGQSYSINELAKRLNEILKTAIKPIHAMPRKGDVRFSRADISLARELLDYRPEVDFVEGLRRSMEWFKERHFSLKGRR